jgi:hypothetical protein
MRLTEMDQEPWFQPKAAWRGAGLTPIAWQGWCVTILMMVVLFATAGVVVATVYDPASVILAILVLTGLELAVFIPFMYRHAKRTRD